MVEGGGFEPPKAEPADLQSAPFGRSGTPPKKIERAILYKMWLIVNVSLSIIRRFHISNTSSTFNYTEKWSPQSESNQRPADYKSAALPAELCGHIPRHKNGSGSLCKAHRNRNGKKRLFIVIFRALRQVPSDTRIPISNCESECKAFARTVNELKPECGPQSGVKLSKIRPLISAHIVLSFCNSHSKQNPAVAGFHISNNSIKPKSLLALKNFVIFDPMAPCGSHTVLQVLRQHLQRNNQIASHRPLF